jgi:hypothetical protein
MRRAAKFFSWLFQPLFMPLIGTFVFLSLPFYSFRLLPEAVYWYVIICNLLFTILLPVLMIFMLLRYGMITSLYLDKREDRIYPIIFTLIFQVANYYFLTRADLPGPYLFFLIAGIFSLLVILIITYYWKVSLHMAGVGGVCGAFLALAVIWPVDLRALMACFFLISGITGSSRLLLMAHSSSQLAIGFFLGFLPQLGLIWLANS